MDAVEIHEDRLAAEWIQKQGILGSESMPCRSLSAAPGYASEPLASGLFLIQDLDYFAHAGIDKNSCNAKTVGVPSGNWPASVSISS
jgi:hypothetical protein